MSHVKRVLMSRGRSSDEADDLVQDAFVKLACYEQENEIVEPEAFLMRIAQNLSLDAYRASKRHGEQVLLDGLVLADPGPPIEDLLLRREQVELLSKALGVIDSKTCSIILANRVDGTSYAQIASEHRMSVSAVEKQIAKAMILLGQAVEDWWP